MLQVRGHVTVLRRRGGRVRRGERPSCERQRRGGGPLPNGTCEVSSGAEGGFWTGGTAEF